MGRSNNGMGPNVDKEERRSGITISHDQLEAIARRAVELIDVEAIARKAVEVSDNARYVYIGKTFVRVIILLVGAFCMSLVLKPEFVEAVIRFFE